MDEKEVRRDVGSGLLMLLMEMLEMLGGRNDDESDELLIEASCDKAAEVEGFK